MGTFVASCATRSSIVDGGFGEHGDEARDLYRQIEEAAHRNRKTIQRPAP